MTQRFKGEVVDRVLEWSAHGSPSKAMKNPHFWAIVVLMSFVTFLYYIDRTFLAQTSPFNLSFFTGIHDGLRVLFFIPVLYAALVYRIQGSLVASLAFLLVILPRAFLFSIYPDAILRPVLFVLFALLTSLIVAILLNLLEKERKSQVQSDVLHRELDRYRQRFEVQLMEQQEQLVQAEKLSSLGQMAASIAHEVNNPLSGILLYTQLLTKKITEGTISEDTTLEYLSKMETELTRSTKLVRNLLDFARQSPASKSDVNVNDILNRALDFAVYLAERQHIQVVKQLDTSIPNLIADSNQLQQVFTNLIINAIQAMPNEGRLTLRTSVNDGFLKIEVQDTGCGISQDNMHKLFTPFFTTKNEVKGVGLGLAVSYGIIQRHQGRIEVQSKEREGTTFTVVLPLCGEDSREH